MALHMSFWEQRILQRNKIRFLNKKAASRFFFHNMNNFNVGGSMWESNPPMRLLTPNTGFEDQRAHQHPSTPISTDCYNKVYLLYTLKNDIIISFEKQWRLKAKNYKTETSMLKESHTILHRVSVCFYQWRNLSGDWAISCFICSIILLTISPPTLPHCLAERLPL